MPDDSTNETNDLRLIRNVSRHVPQVYVGSFRPFGVLLERERERETESETEREDF